MSAYAITIAITTKIIIVYIILIFRIENNNCNTNKSNNKKTINNLENRTLVCLWRSGSENDISRLRSEREDALIADVL